jgi:hypothetical protein
MPRYTTPPKTEFKDEIDINVERGLTRYHVRIEHRPTRLKVEESQVKWCKLHSTKDRLIEELREKVRQRTGKAVR